MYSVPKALDMGFKNSHVVESSLSRLFHQYSGLNLVDPLRYIRTEYRSDRDDGSESQSERDDGAVNEVVPQS